jgi:hypothetical protein
VWGAGRTTGTACEAATMDCWTVGQLNSWTVEQLDSWTLAIGQAEYEPFEKLNNVEHCIWDVFSEMFQPWFFSDFLIYLYFNIYRSEPYEIDVSSSNIYTLSVRKKC